MWTSLRTAVSGMLAQQRALDVAADNLSKMQVPGSKARRVSFIEMAPELTYLGVPDGEGNVQIDARETGVGVKTSATLQNLNRGAFQRTDNPLDVAIDGDGLLEITLPDGQTAYTRAGALQVDGLGRLATAGGAPLSPTIDSLSGTLPGYTYAGDTGQLRREYEMSAYLTINTPGETTFAPAIASLFNLRDHLNAGNAAAVAASDITAVDQALDTILSARVEVGAKMNRVEAAQGRLTLLQVNLEELCSKSEDTDFSEAVSKFSIQETVYKASLEIGGRAIQPSLLDYLR